MFDWSDGCGGLDGRCAEVAVWTVAEIAAPNRTVGVEVTLVRTEGRQKRRWFGGLMGESCADSG